MELARAILEEKQEHFRSKRTGYLLAFATTLLISVLLVVAKLV
jgi:hypothetical protein